MPLQYLDLFYHRDNKNRYVFMEYLIEDGEFIGSKAEKLVEVETDELLSSNLVDLINQNSTMVKNLKFSIGKYTGHDLIVNQVKFVEDIEDILQSLKGDSSTQALRYVSIFKQLMEIIVEVEAKNLPLEVREFVTDIFLNSFEAYALPLYYNQDEIKFQCIIPEEDHDDILQVEFFRGLPLSFCGEHFNRSTTIRHLLNLN